MLPSKLTRLCRSSSDSVLMYFSGGLKGASIIDSLDTLYIMGLMDEYNDAKEWVQTSLDLNSVRNTFFALILVGHVFLFLSLTFYAVTTLQSQSNS